MKRDIFRGKNVMEICICYKEVDFVVHITDYDLSSGSPATRWEPEDPGEFVPNEGYLQVDNDVCYRLGTLKLEPNQIIKSEALFNKVVDEKYQEVLDKAWDAVQDELASEAFGYADYLYEQKKERMMGL